MKKIIKKAFKKIGRVKSFAKIKKKLKKIVKNKSLKSNQMNSEQWKTLILRLLNSTNRANGGYLFVRDNKLWINAKLKFIGVPNFVVKEMLEEKTIVETKILNESLYTVPGKAK